MFPVTTHSFIMKYKISQEEFKWAVSYLQISLRHAHQVIIFTILLPNLSEINLSKTFLSVYNGVLEDFSKNCPFLEKVTWNNIHKTSFIELDGNNMRFSNNLKEIYMDDCTFFIYGGGRSQIFDLNNPALNDYFIFHECYKTLERVSIRNAKCSGSIPQNASIKFVRNVPSLCWFRSDLTQEILICYNWNDPLSNF